MNQIKTGAILSYISLMVNIVIGLLYTPWMIRSIGKADYGLYTLAMSVILLFVLDFGLASAVTRFVAKYVSEGRQQKANHLLAVVYKLYLGIDAIILLFLAIFFFFIPAIYKGLSSDEIEKFKVVYVIAASFSVVSFPFIPLNGILSAYEKFIQLKFCDLANKFIMVILMSLCLWMGYGLYALVVVNAVAGLSIIIFKLFFIRRYTPISIEWNFWDFKELKNIIVYSGWITVEKLSQRCIFAIAPTILGILSDSKAIAVFGVAISLEGYAYTFSTAIGNMFLPRISQFIANGRQDEILPLMIRTGRLQLIIVSTVLLGFIILGREFLCLWLGDGFDELYLCALLLMLPAFIHTPQQVGIDAIVAMNLVGKQAKFYLLMAIVNLVLSIPLTSLFGIYGMSFSIFVAYIVRTLGNNVIFHRDMHLNIKVFFREVYERKTVMVLISLTIVCIGINMFMPSGFWVGFIVKALMFILAYFVVIYMFVMNSSEKQLIIPFFNNIIHFKHKR